MSTAPNNANYVDSEDNAIGEQNININCEDRSETRNSEEVVNVDKSNKWIGTGIVSSFGIIGFLELKKEAQHDG